MRAVASHAVHVAGCRAGAYELTWSQRWLFLWMVTQGASAAGLNVRKQGALHPGTTVKSVLRAIERVMERHDALRTRYPGTGAARRQEVAASAYLEVAQYEAARSTLDGTTAAVTELLADRAFEDGELPIRFAIVTVAGAPATIAFSIFHPSADGIASAVLYEEILRFSVEPDAELPLAWQPCDIAAYEQTATMRKHTCRAEAHLRERLHEAPLAAASGGPAPTTFYWVSMDSTAIAAASLRLAQRYAIGTATAILAGYAVALGRRLDRATYSISMLCANREHPRMRRSVANLFQAMPLTVDLRSGTFKELCRRLDAEALRAYRYGRYDPIRGARTLLEVEGERGGRVDLSYSVNLRVVGHSDFEGQLSAADRARLESHATITDDALRGLVGASVPSELSFPEQRPEIDLSLNVWTLTDVASLTVMGHLPPTPTSELRALLCEMETTLVEAACDDGVTVAVLRDRLAQAAAEDHARPGTR